MRRPLLVPLSSVQALDENGVHVDASAPELPEGTLDGEDGARVASIEQARSRERE
jgi:hypothetical protein